MVRAFLPQSFDANILYNTNFPPQSFNDAGGEPTVDDEDYVLGGDRNSVEFVLGPERNSVDFEMVI